MPNPLTRNNIAKVFYLETRKGSEVVWHLAVEGEDGKVYKHLHGFLKDEQTRLRKLYRDVKESNHFP